jgi:LPS-assembly protein
VGPQIERDFGSFKHVIEPGIDYRIVRGIDRFQNTMLVDEVDLLTDTNEVEYSLTNRLFGRHEFFSWRVSQKYFFDPTFGGAIVPGQRNVFTTLLDLTGFAFADGTRRVSPIVSTMRISTSPSTSADLQVDYDTRYRLFRAAGVQGGLSRGPSFASISYFFTRRSTTHEPNNQLRATIGYGDSLRPGLSGAINLSYDIERTIFQSTVAQIGFNRDCYGLRLEFMQVDVGSGVRKESAIRFEFSLKGIGSIGTLGRQERLY